MCHKRCHVHVQTSCPLSKVSSMQLEHIFDPKTVKEKNLFNDKI